MTSRRPLRWTVVCGRASGQREHERESKMANNKMAPQLKSFAQFYDERGFVDSARPTGNPRGPLASTRAERRPNGAQLAPPPKLDGRLSWAAHSRPVPARLAARDCALGSGDSQFACRSEAAKWVGRRGPMVGRPASNWPIEGRQFACESEAGQWPVQKQLRLSANEQRELMAIVHRLDGWT